MNQLARSIQGMAIRASFRLERVGRNLRTMATASPGRGGYKGGRVDRKNPDWTPPAAGPNLLADWGLDLARRRARDLTANHPNLAGAKRKLAGRVVGTGIGFRVNTEWDALNRELQLVLERAARAVDVGREQPLAASQREWVQEIFDGGDCLAHRPMVPGWNGRPAGPAVQLVVAERVPLELNSQDAMTGTPRPGQPRVRHGVEFDALDRRVAYHVLRAHPADGLLSLGAVTLGSPALVRIPHDQARLGFVRTGAGQVRGVPIPIAAIATIADEARLSDAALMQALMASCIGLIVKGAVPSLFAEYSGGLTDPLTGKPFSKLFPGMIAQLPENADLSSLTPNIPSTHVQEFLKSLKRDEAMAAGLGAGQYTNDFTGTTFSAARMEELDARVFLRWVQADCWEQHTLPYLADHVRAAIASGRVRLTAAQRRAWGEEPLALLEIEPRWPGWEWVNPDQESKAARTEIEIGVASRAQVAARRGVDARSVIDDELDLEAYEAAERERRGLAKPTPPAAGSEEPETDDQIDQETGEPKADPDNGEDREDETDGTANRVRALERMNGRGHA